MPRVKIKAVPKGQTGMLFNPDLSNSIMPNAVSFLGETALNYLQPRDYQNNPWAAPTAAVNTGMSLLKGISGSILDFQKQQESQRVAKQNVNNNFTNNPYNNFYGRGNTYFQDGGLTELTVFDKQGNTTRFDPFKYSTIEEAQDAYALQQQELEASNQEQEFEQEEVSEDTTEQDELEAIYDQENQDFFASLNSDEEDYSADYTGDYNMPINTNYSTDAKIQAFAKIENSGKQIGDHGNGAIDAFGYRKSGHLSEAWKTEAYKGIRQRFGNYNTFYEVLKSGKNPEVNNLNNQLYSNWLESKYPGDIQAQAKFNLTGNAHSPDNTVIGRNLSAGTYTQKIVNAMSGNTLAKKQTGGLVMNKFQKGGLSNKQGNLSSIYTKTDTPNIEWERGEHILLPNGVSFHQSTGNKHSSNEETSGVKAEVPDNTFVFSDFIKAPQNMIKGFLGKKEDDKLSKSEKKFSFADIAKKFETSKDIENQSSEDKFKANSAKLNLINKQPKLEGLKFAQEIYKEGRGMENDLEKLVQLQSQPKPQFGSLVEDKLPIAQRGGFAKNTYQPRDIANSFLMGRWGNNNYWGQNANNLKGFGYTGNTDARSIQDYTAQEFPELVNDAFENYYPTTNKGVRLYGDVPATSLNQEQRINMYRDGLMGDRVVAPTQQTFNSKEEYDNWVATHRAIGENGFYDTSSGGSAQYTLPLYRPQIDPIGTGTVQPLSMDNTRPVGSTVDMPAQPQEVNPSTGMPYNKIDLSSIRMAEAVSMLGAMRPTKVNYPSLRELPTLEQPVLLDQVPIANTAYNKAIGNALSQLKNSGLSPQEKMVASSNVISKSLDQQPNSDLYVAQQNLINNNINRTNKFNIDTLNTKNQMLDRYQAQVNAVYAGKEKDINNKFNSISKYIGNDAERNLEIQQWMSQTGSDYHIGQDGNVYFRPNPMNSFLQEALINLQAMQNNQLTQVQQRRESKR